MEGLTAEIAPAAAGCLIDRVTPRRHAGAGSCGVGLALLLAAAGVAWSPVRAAPAVERGDTAADQAKRVEAVGQLILRSSAAAQITKSGDEAALARYEAVKQTYERALEAHRRGDAKATAGLLDEATRMMFEVVRLAKPDSIVGDKKRADFGRRLRSLEQLLAAYERVGKQKQSDAGKDGIDGPVKEKLARARTLFAAGQLDEARVSLDEAYAAAKLSIEELHSGDTVTRSLNFKSKEEEFHYELDRNDTHRMLLKGILDDKSDRPELEKQARPFADRAAELRREAEAAAAKKSYENAIETLEESTKQLIRAIRAAGVFLPG